MTEKHLVRLDAFSVSCFRQKGQKEIDVKVMHNFFLKTVGRETRHLG